MRENKITPIKNKNIKMNKYPYKENPIIQIEKKDKRKKTETLWIFKDISNTGSTIKPHLTKITW